MGCTQSSSTSPVKQFKDDSNNSKGNANSHGSTFNLKQQTTSAVFVPPQQRLKQATKEEQEQICKKYGFKQDTQKIDLSYKHLGDSGTEDIAKFLAFSSKIKHINLKSNSLGKLASEYLCEALKINKSLEILELQSNELGKDGAAFLFYTLNQNSLNLKELNLEFNSIGSEGGDLISQYLKNMKTQLVKFSLGSNYIILIYYPIIQIVQLLVTNYETQQSQKLLKY